MRNTLILAALAAILIPGCGGGPNPEQEEKSKRDMQMIRLDFDKKFTDLETRYAGVLKMEQQTKNALEEIQKLVVKWDAVHKESNGKLEKVNEVLTASLEVQARALKEQLTVIQNVLADLKKDVKK